VASALGVAILGSIVAVVFRGHLGGGTPAQVAGQLDAPVAVTRQLPDTLRVRPLVTADTSQSIGNALEFVGRSATVLHQRADSTHLTAAQQSAARGRAKQVLSGFVGQSKAAFMSAMRIASLFAGLAALIGAAVAFAFLPGRRDVRAEPSAAAAPVPEPVATG
jgi:hypothetical protein